MSATLLENPDPSAYSSRREAELTALVEKLLGEVAQLRGEVDHAFSRLDQNRRTPAAMLRSLGPPDFAPRLLVQSNDVGVLIGVAILDHHLADEQWTGGGSSGTLEPTQVSRPDMLPVDGVAMKPSAASKEGVDALTVRCTRRRRPAAYKAATIGCARRSQTASFVARYRRDRRSRSVVDRTVGQCPLELLNGFVGDPSAVKV